MSRKKPQWLDRALFIGSHYFTLCTTEKLFRRAMKRFKLPKDQRPNFILNGHSDATIHFFECQGAFGAIVCVRGWEGKTQAQIAGLIAHEAMHLWREIRTTLGEHSPSSELEAYAVGTLTQHLLEEFDRQVRSD